MFEEIFIKSAIAEESIVFPETTSITSNFKGRCRKCWDLIHDKRLIGDRRFVLLQNCTHVWCIDCAIDVLLPLDEPLKCPACQKESNGFIDLDRIVQTTTEKRKFFLLKSTMVADEGQENIIIKLSNMTISEHLDSISDCDLMCQLCFLVVRNSPANPGGHFAITTACFCVMCASCVSDDHRKSKKCPVCLKTSNRIVAHSEFIRTLPEKQFAFNRTSKGLITKDLRCQLCSLVVRNNPANPGGHFAITTACFCVMCASCVTDDHRKSKKCPSCLKTSNRIVAHSEFIRTLPEKEFVFNRTSKKGLNGGGLIAKDLRCQLCSLVVRNNRANPGGLFGITPNCWCVMCASHVTDPFRKSKKCPVCSKISYRIVLYPEFVESFLEKQFVCHHPKSTLNLVTQHLNKLVENISKSSNAKNSVNSN